MENVPHNNSFKVPPLKGILVVDLSRLLPGPLATQHLADLGADVIKVEDTGAGDYASPGLRAAVNRGKRSIRLNLKTAAGRDILLHLCSRAHVLVEGFRPGVMARLGAGYEDVVRVNPSIVYCSVSGFGQDGPLHQLPGHDINYIALSGVADQCAGTDGPALSNLPISDLLGGTSTTTMGVLAALFDAARTGSGRHIDVSIADGVLAHAVLPLALLRQNGRNPQFGETALTGGLACYAFYRTSDGRYVAVGALERKFWVSMCRVLDRPDLEPLHRTGNPQTEQYVRSQLAEVFQARAMQHWAQVFQDSEACVTPVLRFDEALAHPHFVHRGVVSRNDDGAPSLGGALKFGHERCTAHRSASTPGADTAEVLLEAGITADELATLIQNGNVS